MTEQQTSRTAEEQDQPQDATASDENGDEQVEERGSDAPEEKSQQGEDGDRAEAEAEDEESGEGGGEESGEGDGEESEAGKARDFKKEREDAKEEVKQLEEDPPAKLEDWPTGAAKYETLGGPEGEHGYHEGPERKLGPSELRHREDGSVEVEGEEVDEPKDFKGEPVPGGPTDPNTANLRMDKASPEDVSDIAREAAEEKESGGDTERQDGDDGEERGREDDDDSN